MKLTPSRLGFAAAAARACALGRGATTVLLGLAAVTAAGSDIVVKRGQTKVDPSLLPLVCLEVGTAGIALPIDSITFTNLATHVDVKKTVSQLFHADRPDLLTAVAPDALSLSLAILHFPPGRYEIKSIDFVTGSSTGYLTLAVSGSSSCHFDVQPGCVNYLGGIEISTEWDAALAPFRRQLQHNEVSRGNFRIQIQVTPSGRRDVKWACDVDPGMLALPATLAPLRMD